MSKQPLLPSNAILIQDVKVGQKFYKLNKMGHQQYNENTVFEMAYIHSSGQMFEYDRIGKDKRYVDTTLYPQYVVVINN